MSFPLNYKPTSAKTVSEASSSGYNESLTIAVEGNIGAGKSTFLEYCDTRPECVTFAEPVDKWRNLNGVNVLSEFYSDRQRWGLPFQLYAGMTLLDHYSKPTWKTLKIVERSIHSSQ
ncbi:hypothetical protein HA402_009704 [Bradysia odoriphaga]|nr:hypothetical protein HA402_009704 [Bradysia odoriphaga]